MSRVTKKELVEALKVEKSNIQNVEKLNSELIQDKDDLIDKLDSLNYRLKNLTKKNEEVNQDYLEKMNRIKEALLTYSKIKFPSSDSQVTYDPLTYRVASDKPRSEEELFLDHLKSIL